MAYSAQLSTTQLKAANENLIELKEKTEALLRKKGFIVSKDLSGELKGDISGSMNGSYSETSRLSSALGLSVLGLFAGFFTGGLAVPGLVAGGLAGAVLPEEIASGQIRGELKGKIEGQQWDNVRDGSIWGIIVIEPSQLERIKKFNEKQRASNSECAAGYAKIISDIIQSKKYFTRAEVDEMLQNVSQIRSLVTSIEASLGSYKEKNELLSYINPFFSKKILFSSVGINFAQKDHVGIVTDMSYAVDFVGLKYKEKNEEEFKSIPKFQVDEQRTSEELAQISLDKLKKFAFKKRGIFQVKQYQKENFFETDNISYVSSRNGLFIFTDDHLFSQKKITGLLC